MKKIYRRLKKSLLFLISSTLITAGTIIGCAGGWDFDESLFSFFAPEVSKSDYEPFFRSYHLLYNNTGEYGSNIHLFNEVNVREWDDFFNDKVLETDLSFLLYNSGLSAIDSLIFHIKDQKYKLRQPLASNSIVRYNDKMAVKDFLFYLGFARRCEKVSAVEVRWFWDEEEKKKAMLSIEEHTKLIENGRKAMDRQTNTFIKERYAFQLARLLYFAGRYNEAIELVNTTLASLQYKNSIEHRLQGYKAASYYKQGDFVKANLIYAQMFMLPEPYRTTGYLSFHPVHNKDWEATLRSAGTNDERKALWCLFGLYYDGLRAMEEIYTIDPASDYMSLLLVREVRKQEEARNAHRDELYTENEDLKLQLSTSLNDLQGFIAKVKGNAKLKDQFLWELSDGYLSYISGEKDQMSKSLDLAMKLAGNDKSALTQIRMIRLLADVREFKPGNKKQEDHISEELDWVIKGADGFYSTQTSNVKEHVLNILSEKYSGAGNLILAECFLSKPESYYVSQKASQDMIEFIAKQGKSLIEKLAASIYNIKAEDIYGLEAIRAFYKGDFDKAMSLLEKSPSAANKELPGDPFIIHINDCHDCDHEAAKKITHTRMSLLKEMKELKKMADSGGAEESFLLANAYYNITYFGNAREFYTTHMTYYHFVTYQYNISVDKDPVYDCSKAEAYYVNAMQRSTDKEFKAKCCFMASKCEQNSFFNSRPSDYMGDFKSGNYFEKLKNDYSMTSYYKEVIRECGYFRTYVTL